MLTGASDGALEDGLVADVEDDDDVESAAGLGGRRRGARVGRQLRLLALLADAGAIGAALEVDLGTVATQSVAATCKRLLQQFGLEGGRREAVQHPARLGRNTPAAAATQSYKLLPRI